MLSSRIIALLLFALFAKNAWAQLEVHKLPLLSRTTNLNANGGDQIFQGDSFVLKTDLEVARILPKQFRFANHKMAQAMIDRLTLRIFESASARRGLCFLNSQENNDIRHFLGVSKKAAIEIGRMCGPVKLTKLQSSRLVAMKAKLFSEETFQKPKNYAFAFPAEEVPKIEGFTAKSGMTLIVLNQREVSEARLIRLMSHEIAMSFDQLGSMSTKRFSFDWDWHLNVIYSKDSFGRVFKDPTNLEDFRCALRDPAIRYGAATERAIRFEDQVIADLGLSALSPPLASTESCARTIGVRAVQISPIVALLESEIQSEQLREDCGVDFLKDARRAQTLVGRIKFLAATQLEFVGGGSINLCELLVNPRIGPRHPENDRHSGPRPRIGGWDGN